MVAEEIRKKQGRGYKIGPMDKCIAVIAAGRGRIPQEECTDSEKATINWIGLALQRCWDRQSAGAEIAKWPIDKIALAVHDLIGEAGDLDRDEVCNLLDRYAIRCEK